MGALIDPETRENALLDLSKKRDLFADLAPILWHSYGVIPALLQEIVSIYPLLSPPSLTAHASNRVCNALALLQCVASHPDTRALFLNGAPPRLRGARAATAGGTRCGGARAARGVAPRELPCPNPALFEPDSDAPRPAGARSTHPAVLVPVSQHGVQDAAV